MLKIIEKEGKKFVTLSELYSKLELDKTHYQRFIKEQISQNEYAQEGKDFSPLGAISSGGRPKADYLLSNEFAKDIILRSKSKVGKKFRDWLISLEKQKDSGDLLTHEQIIYLVQLKEVFKYLSNCKEAQQKHLEKFVKESDLKNPYAEFYTYRNQILGLGKKEIDNRIKAYWAENSIAIKAKTQADKLALLDKYEILRNGIWDFLECHNSEQSLKLANLAMQMARTENLPVLKKNEDTLFSSKEENNDFKKLN